MEKKILDFIQRRFPKDCNWTDGNCYFFALILQNVFGGEIYYDVINGHFVAKIGRNYYDWTGKVRNIGLLVEWDKFSEYDSLQKERIIRDCIE